jgi:hypothetical protein
MFFSTIYLNGTNVFWFSVVFTLFPPATTSVFGSYPQSMQSAKLFSMVVGTGTHQTPFLQASVPPPPPVPGRGAHSLACGERGDGRVPIPGRGHTLWYIYVLCGPTCHLSTLHCIAGAALSIHMVGEVSWGPKRRRSWAS